MNSMDEYIGVYFKIRENTNLKVEEILSLFEYRKLQWQVRNSAVYLRFNDEIQDGDLFEEIDLINDQSLRDLLKSTDYYSIFLSLRGFPSTFTDEEINKTSITNLNQFLNSPCEVYFMQIDYYEISILIKNKNVLEIAYQHAKQLGGINVRLIEKTEEWYLE